MNSKLFIANKFKVGFNLRNDTYTGKLGYVIGHDGKTWRKEPSWESWRYKYMGDEEYEKRKRELYDGAINNIKNSTYYNEEQKKTQLEHLGGYENYKPHLGKYVNDKTIEPVEFDNVPTEGFVLNKKTGGYSSGWNHRSTYCRVYDPRGFEFEISIPNLLFILGECNAMKGKGLEGSFVYAWDGKDLVLLPTSCQEYSQSTSFTKLQSGKIGVKDLVEGCTYKTKQLDEYIYLGKFNWFIGESKISIKKNFTFCRIEKPKYGSRFMGIPSLSSFVQRVTDVPVSNYAELLDEFNDSSYSGILKDVKEEGFVPNENVSRYSRNNAAVAMLPIGENKYELYDIIGIADSYSYYNNSYSIKHYDLSTNKIISIKNNDFNLKSVTKKTIEKVSKVDLLKMNLKVLKINKNNIEKQIQF